MNRAARIKRMLSPSCVAWFGGGALAPAIEYMCANGFVGEALAVHPKRDEIAGLACVSSVEALPWVPDLAILVIPKEAVIDTVAALSELGCGGVICIASGFSESADGQQRQAELISAAGDMPLIGPNCPGFANFLDGCAFMMDHFGLHAPAKGAAVISNGGAYLSDLGCADRSQPIAYLIGLGNQAMVSVADMLDVVLDDPRITAVNVYFEGINDVPKLSQAAAKAALKGIPVVAVKGGQSAAGARAAQSHTASLSGDAAVASALFKRFCWIEVHTPSEAIETLKMLSYTPIPKGLKTGFITSSGSYAVLGGDVAEKVGLILQPPTAENALAIDAALPAYVGPANPLDISDAHGWPLVDQLPIYRAFARDDYDVFAQVMCYPPEGGWDMSTWDTTTEALAAACEGRPAAFINTLAEALPKSARERMIQQGMAPLQGLEDGLRAVAHAARFGAEHAKLDRDAILVEAADGVSEAPVILSEAAAKQWLSQSGIPIPQQWVVKSAEVLPAVGGRCALKALVPGLLHKSEAGAVTLDLTPQDLPAAMEMMAANLQRQGLSPEGFLIEEMVESPVAEVLVGIRRIEGTGLVLTLAIGGVMVELLQDTATLVLPASRSEIESTLLALKLSPLLTGHRGRASVNMVATLDAIEALCQFVQQHAQIAELEINPLLLTRQQAFVADAVLTHIGEYNP